MREEWALAAQLHWESENQIADLTQKICLLFFIETYII